ILELPLELQFMILRYLNFADLERLRRTCHFFRDRITKSMIRDLFPSLRYELLSTCYRCLCYDPLRSRLVRADESNERYPFANECIQCVVKGSGFMVGHKVRMGNFSAWWICRWCGHPVSDGGAWEQSEFHYRCYKRYHKTLFYFFIAGCVQWTFVIVGSSLCWAYFRKDKMVLKPTIVRASLSRVQALAAATTKLEALAADLVLYCRRAGLLDVSAERRAGIPREMVVQAPKKT
ncbi:hypothetical protein BGZ63DRAFT_322288, partial [Mariannaea sp. PMI_226]